MDPLDRKTDFGGGGRASGGGGFYHLSFRSGSRARGASARASFSYVSREGEYDSHDRDPAVHVESDHMPGWARESPEDYWDAADLYERANGRLFVSADFALPRGLDLDDQVDLAHAFAQELTGDEQLPYTLAVHAGRSDDGREHNPHAHLMFSERRNDGVERAREDWFRRANAEHPERGGAPKSRTFHGPAWIERARERWATLTNEALERAGRADRVDHRSYDRRGIDREPGEHYGPAAAHVVGRGGDHDRLDGALTAVSDERAIGLIDGQIAQLEADRETLLHHDVPDDDRPSERREQSGSFGAGRDDDGGWER